MKQWHCHINGQKYGPVDEPTLKQWIAEGRLGKDDLVWSEGMAEWVKLSAVAELSGDATPPSAFSMSHTSPPPGTGGSSLGREITAMARNSLSGRWGLPIGFSLLLTLMQMVLQNLPYIGGLAPLILGGPFALGGTIFFLTFTRGGNGDLGMLFAGFKNFGTALVAHLLITLYILLWTLAYSSVGIALLIAGAILKSDGGNILMKLGFIGLIPGYVIMIMVSLSYSQSMYIIADESSVKASIAIARSKKMMDGNKARLFFLGLRFIGWSLLCVLTLGIGFLWLIPYISSSFAHFHDDLRPVQTEALASESPTEPQQLGQDPPKDSGPNIYTPS